MVLSDCSKTAQELGKEQVKHTNTTKTPKQLLQDTQVTMQRKETIL